MSARLDMWAADAVETKTETDPAHAGPFSAFDADNPFDIADDAPRAVGPIGGGAPVRSPFPAPSQVSSELRAVAVTVDADTDDDALVSWLSEQSWSSFATDLVRQVRRGRPLSDRQREAAQRMRAKCETRAAERATASAARAARPAGPSPVPYRIYETTGGELFAVVVSQQGRPYVKVWNGRGWQYEGGAIGRLGDLLADGAAGLASAEKVGTLGKAWGRCLCCGRALTDAVSVETGIGPVCAGKWGLG